MKVLRGLLLAFLICFAAPVFAQKQIAIDFKDTLRKATIAVYHGKQKCEDSTVDSWLGPMKEWGCQFQRRFTCTATVIRRLSQIEYVGLTAGHCFDWSKKDEYFVTDKIGTKPVLHHINIIKFENDDRYDYGIFTFSSLSEYPIIEADTERLFPSVGSSVLNVNYSFGLVKQTTEGKVVSEKITDPAIRQMGDLKGRYLVDIGIGPGASGSAVVDAESHKIVGIVEAIFPGTQMPAIVMPLGQNFKDFTEDDSASIKPEEALKSSPNNGGSKSMKSPWQSFVDWLNKVL